MRLAYLDITHPQEGRASGPNETRVQFRMCVHIGMQGTETCACDLTRMHGEAHSMGSILQHTCCFKEVWPISCLKHDFARDHQDIVPVAEDPLASSRMVSEGTRADVPAGN